jgi:hypothetical protein
MRYCIQTPVPPLPPKNAKKVHIFYKIFQIGKSSHYWFFNQAENMLSARKPWKPEGPEIAQLSE